MKMAKANRADLDMALELVRMLDSLGQHPAAFPEAIERLSPGQESERFDRDDDAHCGRALRHMLNVCRRGSLSRVVWGMATLLDPKTRVVDPTADTLEQHPDVAAALAAMKASRTVQEEDRHV